MKFFHRLRALFRKETLDREMSEEMRHHLELQVAQNLAAGMNPDEARYRAQRQFGGVEQIKERARDVRNWVWLEQLLQDLRYAGRALNKSRGFTAVAVITLALGIGVSTAMFSVMYGVVLSPYPYAKSHGIWSVYVGNAKNPGGVGLNIGDYLEVAKLPGIASATAISRTGSLSLPGESGLELVDASRLSTTAFSFLGVPPLVGRSFTSADIKPNGDAEPVVVLSYKLWQHLFAGDPHAIGQTLLLDQQPYVIIGVMPERFGWGGDGVWLPLTITDRKAGTGLYVRLQPGVSPKIAEQQLRGLFERLARESPERFPKEGFVANLGNFVDGGSDRWGLRSSIRALFWATGCLLLIACTNVANLQLARGAGRSREIAVRLAIGASRSRVIRQLLTESVLLSVVAGAAGLLLAFGLTHLVVTLLPDYLPREARISVNGWVLAYSTGAALLSGVLFGLAPALRSTQTDLNDALKEGGHAHGLGGRPGTRLRNTLIVVEVALSIVLLVGATLAIRNFSQLQQIDRGFNPERIAWLRIDLLPRRYATTAQRNEFSRALLERVRVAPGVASAAVGPIPNFEAATRATIPGQPAPVAELSLNFVSADYFRTLAIPVLAGRTFTAQEIAHGDHVAVISVSASRQWPAGENPIGSVVQLESLAAEGPAPSKDFIVIGIVADTLVQIRLGAGRRNAPRPGAFVPYPLRGDIVDAPNRRYMVVRGERELEGLFPVLRQAVRSVDPEQPLGRSMNFSAFMELFVAQPRFNMNLFSGLAVITLALAAAGIYSVLSYSVAQRTREFGVRMALGASPREILQLVLRGGAWLLLFGACAGVAASLALSQILNSQVFEIPLLDPWALGAAVIVLSLIGLFACYLPARRATKVDPMVALRCE